MTPRRALATLLSLGLLGIASVSTHAQSTAAHADEAAACHSPPTRPESTFDVFPVIALRHYGMTLDDLSALADFELLFVRFNRTTFSQVDEAVAEANADLIILNPDLNVGIVRVRGARNGADTDLARSKLKAHKAVASVEPGYPDRAFVRQFAIDHERAADKSRWDVPGAYFDGSPRLSNVLRVVDTLIAELRKHCPRRGSGMHTAIVLTIDGKSGFVTDANVLGLHPANADCMKQTFQRRPYWVGRSGQDELVMQVDRRWN